MSAVRFDGLRHTVEQAIADGHAARRASEQQANEGRIEEVMSALPQRVTKAVAGAQTWPVRCVVMIVQPSEYQGPTRYYPYDTSLKPPVYVRNLRGAAKRIFEELHTAGYEPTLTYVHPLDFENWTGTSMDHHDLYAHLFDSDRLTERRNDYHDLCICISVR
jgi:hypothetical protein